MLVRFSSATEREGSETFYDVEQGKKDNIEPTCSEEGLLTHAVPRRLCEGMYRTLSLCVNTRFRNGSGKKPADSSLCPQGARLVFIVPSAINPPFANNIGMNLILITALGSLPRPRLHVIRFQGRAGAERHLP
jgi:hypothetical protein